MKNQNEHTGMKILVVEDCRTQADYLRHILESEGYQVVIAVNGNDALTQIGINPPAIVLTDIVMPEMDGYTLCSAIKQNANTAHIPVILVTQLFDPADVMKGLEAGADNLIIKPFEPEHVISRLRSTLEPLAQRDSGDAGAIRESSFPGQMQSIPPILLSTYDLAIRQHAELQGEYEHLTAVNWELRRTVDTLQRANEQLSQENAGLRRMEDALAKSNKKLQMMASITHNTLLNQLAAMHECLELANTIREKDPAMAWEQIAKAELVMNQTLNTVKFRR